MNVPIQLTFYSGSLNPCRGKGVKEPKNFEIDERNLHGRPVRTLLLAANASASPGFPCHFGSNALG